MTAFLGTFDFDDVRSSTSPPASQLQLSVATAAAPGVCSPVFVRFEDSFSVAAPAPYDAFVTTQVSAGVGGFYSDGACASPTTGVTVPSGSTEAMLYFRGQQEGVVLLDASHPDFIAGSAQVSIVAIPDDAGATIDAGADDDAGSAFDGGSTVDAGASTDTGADANLDIGNAAGADAGELSAGSPPHLAVSCAQAPHGGRRWHGGAPVWMLFVLIVTAVRSALRR